jgi:zinc protease
VDDENLRNQRDVVKEEVRVNVLNQPYGGFPWLDLPPVAYRNWANAHNFYGDFADLDAATLEDVRKFFQTYYAPSNAVLLILGDVGADQGFALAERYFSDIPSGPQPAPADVTEPPQREERRGVVEEKFGTLPGVAIGYQSPQRLTPEWYAAALLDQTLHGGRAGRVYRRMVLERQIAVDAEGGIHYPVGDLFDYNGPTLMVTRLLHKPEYSADQTIAAYDEVVNELTEQGITPEELEPIKVKFESDYFSMLEGGHGSYIPRYGLMHLLACFTLFDNDPHLVNKIPGGFLEVAPANVQSAAQELLTPSNRSIVIRQPVKKGTE